jgi:hypothetical protein
MEALLAFGAIFMVFAAVIGIFMIVTYWILFNKAGQPGWAVLIPIYNILIMLKVAGKPWWWIFGFLLAIIPVVGQILIIVLLVLIYHSISVNFGKDAGFTVGLVLLPIVFFPILAFGNATYNPVQVAAPAVEPVADASPESEAPAE